MKKRLVQMETGRSIPGDYKASGADMQAAPSAPGETGVPLNGTSEFRLVTRYEVPIEAETVQQLKFAGFSLIEIAEFLGCETTEVTRLLRGAHEEVR
tara:strand:+ start:330 stop:620 length:291 start_codon:yes stop_codon:yes gene_type:complete